MGIKSVNRTTVPKPMGTKRVNRTTVPKLIKDQECEQDTVPKPMGIKSVNRTTVPKPIKDQECGQDYGSKTIGDQECEQDYGSKTNGDQECCSLAWPETGSWWKVIIIVLEIARLVWTKFGGIINLTSLLVVGISGQQV